MNKNSNIKIKHEDTYGIGDDFMISQIKIGKTTFIVASYFEKERSFSDVMEQVIKHKIKAS